MSRARWIDGVWYEYMETSVLRRWPPWQKPIRGTQLNRSHPLASRGLVGLWALNEFSGNKLFDLTGNKDDLVLRAGTTWGMGGVLTNATNEGAILTVGASGTALHLGYPLTLMWYGNRLGTPTAGANTFGMAYDNANSDPWTNFNIMFSGTDYGLHFNDGGTYRGLDTNVPNVNGEQMLVATITSAAAKLYKDSVLLGTTTTGAPFDDPTWSATSQLSIGDYPGISRNPNMVSYLAGIWNRELTPAEIQLLYREPYGMFL